MYVPEGTLGTRQVEASCVSARAQLLMVNYSKPPDQKRGAVEFWREGANISSPSTNDCSEVPSSLRTINASTFLSHRAARQIDCLERKFANQQQRRELRQNRKDQLSLIIARVVKRMNNGDLEAIAEII